MTLKLLDPGNGTTGWGLQQKAAGRITEKSDTPGPYYGSTITQMECRPTDIEVFGSNANARCEINWEGPETFGEGTEFYYAWTHVSVSGHIPSNAFSYWMQTHAINGINGQPPFGCNTLDGYATARVWDAEVNSSSNQKSFRFKTAAGADRLYQHGARYECALRVVLSRTTSLGRVEFWVNGVKVCDLAAALLYSTYQGGSRDGQAAPASADGQAIKHGWYSNSFNGQTRFVRSDGMRLSHGTGRGWPEVLAGFLGSGWTALDPGSGGSIDTTPPNLSVTSPAEGAVVAGTIEVAATASDASGVARVEVERAGTVVAADTTAPYLLPVDTTTWPEGPVSFTVRAVDQAGNAATVTRPVEVRNASTLSDLVGPWTQPQVWDVAPPAVGDLVAPWTEPQVWDVGSPGFTGPWTDPQVWELVGEAPIIDVPDEPWRAPTYDWSLHLLDRQTGLTVATAVPRSIRFSRRLSRGAPAQVALPLEDQAAAVATNGQLARVLVSVDGSTPVCWHAGVVADHSVQRDASGRGQVALEIPDPLLANLDGRYLQAPLPGPYAGTEQWAIIENLVAWANAREPTHLGVAAAATGVSRDRTYELGKSVGEAVRQLAQVIDGPFFVVEPVDPLASGSVEVARLVPRWPSAGQYRPAAQIGYGLNTVGNLAAYTLRRTRPVNYVICIGGEVEGAALIATALDQASIDQHGMHAKVLSLTDVTVQATLQQHADAALTTQEEAVAIEVTLPAAADRAPRAPMLVVDFDVGDVLPVALPEGNWNATVTEATVEVDVNGVPRISGMALVADPAMARRYRRPADAVSEVLGEQERRIRNIESG